MTTKEDKTKRLLRYGTLVPPALTEGIEELKKDLLGQLNNSTTKRICRNHIESLLDNCIKRGEIEEYKLTEDFSMTTYAYKLIISTTEMIELDKVVVTFDLTIGDIL